ncbi:uncharacterized protein EDB91DRAFT_1225300 [Suillus paluster]|uniref:uncharacterized protein n=1 Tax=Suillus paluster TaxID=48578 RepID=UPI001B873A5A|nr:uncharacterized protein EDB91DRAFT_1225300 [Suillus paluster]KAG1735083.1 hypothetical protein EDB91DRAFT_1225300 [Suillus paluster]
MSLARANLLLRQKYAVGSVSVIQRRFVSHDSHTHHEHHDDTHYSREAGFFTPFWRNTALVSLLAVGFYKWAPSPNQDVYLTRWLAQYMTPRDFWAAINEKHLLLSQQASDNTILQADAKRPNMHRYRYPQILDSGSPHLQPVGCVADTSSTAVRSG